MRMPRLRFTVRWLMVAVAIAGVSAWGLASKRRRDAALGCLTEYRESRALLVASIGNAESMGALHRSIAQNYRTIANNKRTIANNKRQIGELARTLGAMQGPGSRAEEESVEAEEESVESAAQHE